MKFRGSVKYDKANFPALLTMFITNIIAGEHSSADTHSLDVEHDTCTISNTIMYSMKSSRQLTYKTHSENPTLYVKNQNLNHIGMGLVAHQRTRDKRFINLLSSYKLCIPYKEVLYTDTAIANAMIDNMQENNNIYIPANFTKGVIPTYHIDNIDFSEDTPSGGGTTHALNVVVFQPRNVSPTPKIELDLHMPIPSTTGLNDNTFGDLKECRKPSFKDFIRPISCLSS